MQLHIFNITDSFCCLLGTIQVLHQRVRGGWGFSPKSLMLLMPLGGVGGLGLEC